MTADAIVVGLGGMGSAAAFHLARRGAKVLGFEQFPFAHDRGSSHGQTRIIRTAYYEHPDYIPLVRRAFANWHDLEQESGKHLLTQCDCLSIGPADGELIAGVSLAATRLAPGAVQSLSATEIERETPFKLPRHFEGRRESQAGFLFVEECVRTHLQEAIRRGADLRMNVEVLGWKSIGNGVEVQTTAGVFHTAKLIVTAGPWATTLMNDLSIPLSVMRQTMQWHVPYEPKKFRRDRFPIFLVQTPAGEFYGLPMIDSRGVKLARHYGADERNTPADIDRDYHDRDAEPVQRFMNQYLPGCFTGTHTGSTCIYTLTPDKHFLIDRHPQQDNVIIAAGFSGHGFKFASVVGEILADLATESKPVCEISMFSADQARRASRTAPTAGSATC